MLPVSRAAVIRELDRRFIEDVGLPSAVLMEHAGHLCCDRLLARYGHRPVLILCGPGNNGGDGYVMGRHLRLRGVPVRCVPVFPPRSPECQIHARVAEKLGIVGEIAGFEAGVVVDAIYGTGQRAPLNLKIPHIQAPWVALDVPTGIDADTGQRIGDFPAPEHIITIGRLKPCVFTGPWSFEWVDIGLDLQARETPEAFLADPEPCPPFSPHDNKWSRGHLGLLCGTPEKAGAAVLACRGALRGGVGLLTLHIAAEAWGRLATLPPEVMLARPETPWPAYDAWVVGPGLGRSQDAQIAALWRDFPGPMVVDADALRALPADPPGGPRLLTPHAGEAAALLQAPWRELEGDRLQTARRLAKIAPCIYKGPHPMVAVDGQPIWIYQGALPQLGTAGSGDVLAGLCGALAARLRPVDAVGMGRVGRMAVSRQLAAARAASGPGVSASEMADLLLRDNSCQ